MNIRALRRDLNIAYTKTLKVASDFHNVKHRGLEHIHNQ